MRGYRKRIYSVPGFVRDAAGMAMHADDLARVYLGKIIPPALRERLWVTVSGVNECRYCLFVHSHWAAREGVEGSEAEALRDGDWSFLTDVEHQPAIDFVRAWAQAEFAQVPDEVARDFERAFAPGPRRGVRAVAQFANLSNRTGNTFDALLARLQGNKSHGSRLIDELVISGVFLSAAAVVAPAMLVFERKAPWTLVREFRKIARHVFI